MVKISCLEKRKIISFIRSKMHRCMRLYIYTRAMIEISLFIGCRIDLNLFKSEVGGERI